MLLENKLIIRLSDRKLSARKLSDRLLRVLQDNVAIYPVDIPWDAL